jgi:hypothetical protein
VDRRHVFGCLLDREGSESPLSPRSLPIGSILRDGGSESVPIRFLLGSSPYLGSRIRATEVGFL